MTTENIGKAWQATKEKASNAVNTVRDPEFQNGVKEGVTSFFSNVKRGSSRLLGYLTEQDVDKPEQPKQEEKKEKEELDWDDEQDEIKKE